ncbi:MAG: hypothetical protein KGL39_35535 [Patescibacteria group bacterium]|nr:hypothetical protein [Patescibacteria group bacterium]
MPTTSFPLENEVQCNTTATITLQVMQVLPGGGVGPFDVSRFTVGGVILGPYAQGQPQTRYTRAFAYVTDGTDGWVTYKTTSAEINQPGNWQVQLTPTDGGSNNYPSTTYSFRARANL